MPAISPVVLVINGRPINPHDRAPVHALVRKMAASFAPEDKSEEAVAARNLLRYMDTPMFEQDKCIICDVAPLSPGSRCRCGSTVFLRERVNPVVEERPE